MNVMYNGRELKIDGADILFRNFSGAEGQYNAKGIRNFCLLLDEETAGRLIEDGWNVKQLKPRDDAEPPQNYIKVAVNFDGKFPPTVYMIANKSKTKLVGDDCSVLDYAELADVKLIVTPSRWEMNGKSGIKAYLKALYATIVVDEFAKMFEDYTEEGAVEARDFTDPEEMPF